MKRGVEGSGVRDRGDGGSRRREIRDRSEEIGVWREKKISGILNEPGLRVRRGLLMGYLRRFIKLVLAIIMLCASIEAGDCAAERFNPQAPPGLPSAPPPLTGSLPEGVFPPPTGKVQPDVRLGRTSIPVPAGWSVISFPFARLTNVSGLSRTIYFYTNGAYYPVDPVKYPDSVNTRWAYLAFAEKPETVTVTGILNRGMVRSIPLASGWNLIGCPYDKPLPWGKAYVERINRVLPLKEVTGPPADDRGNWLSSTGFVYDGAFSSESILSPDAVFHTGRGQWVFAWHPVTLVASGRRPGSAGPQIISLVPNQIPPGEAVAVQGKSFGTVQGKITISGVPVPQEYMLSWGDSQIEFRLPPFATSGDLIVYANRAQSNAIGIRVLDVEAQPDTGTLMGKVQEATTKKLLKGALIMLDNGLSARSNDDGSFAIANVPGGKHGVNISLIGYGEAKGSVNVSPGGSDAVLITLIPAGAQLDSGQEGETGSEESNKISSPKKGILHVVADTYDDGYHRWWVCRIEVTEWGNSNFHWYNDWYSDAGDTYQELDCNGARVDSTYIIKVSWVSRDGGQPLSNSWYRKMYSTHQTETIDSPETLVH